MINKNKLINCLTFIMLIIIILVSILLPNFLLQFSEQKLLGQPQIEIIDVPLTDQNNGLTWVQKIHLLQSENSNSVLIAQGRNFNQENIIEHTKNELATFNQNVLENNLDLSTNSNLVLHANTTHLLIDTTNPNLMAIMWTIVITDHEHNYLGLMQLDDETGKIISLTISQNQEFEIDEQLAQRLAAYQNAELFSLEITNEREYAVSTNLLMTNSNHSETLIQAALNYQATFIQASQTYYYTLNNINNLIISPAYEISTTAIRTLDLSK